MKQWWKKHAGKLAGVLVLLILAGFGLTYWREIWAVLTQPQARDAFIEFVRGKGVLGVFIFLGIQLLQVVVAFLPGEAVEFAAGLLYGTWAGLLLCLLGILLASCTVYAFVRLFGAKRIDEKAFTKYRFLRDEAHIRFSVFLVFFIPGTPKDLLTYLGPFLPIPAWQFLIISTLARHSVGAHQYLCRKPAGRGLVAGVGCRVWPSQGLWPFCAWRLKNTSSPGSGGGTQKNNGKLSCNMLY